MNDDELTHLFSVDLEQDLANEDAEAHLLQIA